MSGPKVHEVEHEITVAASAKSVYQLLVEVENWPLMFPPSVHVERLEQSGENERIRIWATANGAAKTWTSRRRLVPAEGRIEFRQEVSSPPVAAMGGAWIVEADGEERCRVRLLHDYRAVDDDPAALEWIAAAVDRNSHAELDALKATAEGGDEAAGKLLSFEDTTQIAGTAQEVFDFINEADLWAERLPHVARVELEDEAGLQLLEMDTRTTDGSTHTTKSVRVCLSPGRILYKQIQLPALMTLHTGQWRFEENADGVLATSQHTVVINEANIASVLGAQAGLEEARAMVRKALGTNSLSTLAHAKAHVEGGR
ncbi:aromatase/cyclase [Streptomyces purpureus]|uniref:Actinorhodin polyketide synthase bifunctional cyclase/dehydratase n=1 Tax=Streptomyces purpureus TaxID=1951 RepID=A0A918GYZ2_9ACTN|nr:aromatase/cyclase [Streptomyces purpureus]GGT19275.1 actinorhodin polyketide synthase bifunctional cyclase/dehydratase [Streptomyces purpureus]